MISATALRNIREVEQNVPALKPFTKDVQKLHAYLMQEQDKWYKLLSESPPTRARMEVAKLSLVQIAGKERYQETPLIHMMM